MRAWTASLVVALLCVAPASVAGGEEPMTVVVVVAKGSKIDGISHADLRRAFTGTAVTADGGRLVPFNYSPASFERAKFDRAILGMAPDEAGRFWVDRKVRGQSGPPRALPSSALVAKVVAKFPGAIGYLPADQVTADLKVIAIGGLLPTDAGYPLRGK
jgi:hypothetical protein